MANENGVNDPQLPRRRKIPSQFNSSGTENFTFPDIESKYRQSYFEALGLIITRARK